MIQGFKKGLVRTVVSMAFFIIVGIATLWLNPYVGEFIRDNTDWQEKLEEQCEEFILHKLERSPEVSGDSQTFFIEELPLPQSVKEKLIENNNIEVYRKLAVDNFSEYLSGCLSYGIMNGITFLISFFLTIIIGKVILYAVYIVTELPVISMLNRIGGMTVGLAQGILWIWIIFLIITLLYDTQLGSCLMSAIEEDPVLLWIYDRNYLVQVIMNLLVS